MICGIFANCRIEKHSVLYHDDLKVNTQEHPNIVCPQKNERSCVKNGILIASLKCKSWNVVVMRAEKQENEVELMGENFKFGI